MELLSHPIRVVHYGLGATGSAIARLTTVQRGLQVVGGIDRDPAKVDRDLGEVIDLGRAIGAPVSDDASAILARTHPDVVIHATSSIQISFSSALTHQKTPTKKPQSWVPLGSCLMKIEMGSASQFASEDYTT